MCTLFLFPLSLVFFSSSSYARKVPQCFQSLLTWTFSFSLCSRLLWIISGLSELKIILRIILFKSSVIRHSSSASRVLSSSSIWKSSRILSWYRFAPLLISIFNCSKLFRRSSTLFNFQFHLVLSSWFELLALFRVFRCSESTRLHHILISFNSAPLKNVSSKNLLLLFLSFSNWTRVFAFFPRIVLN